MASVLGAVFYRAMATAQLALQLKCKEWGHLEAAASACRDDDKLRRLNAFYFYSAMQQPVH